MFYAALKVNYLEDYEMKAGIYLCMSLSFIYMV